MKEEDKRESELIDYDEDYREIPTRGCLFFFLMICGIVGLIIALRYEL